MSEPDISDEVLMQRYQAGDAAAFDALYARYRRALFGFLVNQSNKAYSDVEEVFQESWLKVIRYQQQFDGSQRFAPWLYTIARNTLVDRWRHLGTVSSLQVSNEPAMLGASSNGLARPDRLAESDDIDAAWRRALAALPAEQREVVLLQLESDLTLEEIGHMVGVGRETVKSRLRYAMNKLRQSLGTLLDDGLQENKG